jgi:hypothetical protein
MGRELLTEDGVGELRGPELARQQREGGHVEVGRSRRHPSTIRST